MLERKGHWNETVHKSDHSIGAEEHTPKIGAFFRFDARNHKGEVVIVFLCDAGQNARGDLWAREQGCV